MVSLLKLRRPFVVGVVVEPTVARSREISASAFREGADAVELNLASLRSGEAPRRGFFAGLRHPVYTSCRRAKFMGVYGARFASVPVLSDEERMERQLDWLSAGSAGLDIEADTFAATRDEWTKTRDAVRGQRAIADATHRGRGAVIFSWHPPRTVKFPEAHRAALELRARGADFVKIVVRVRDAREALDAAHISLQLRDALDFPFVFLPIGPGAESVRPYMTAFGAAYLLARPSRGSNRLPAQPLVPRARALVDLA